VKSAAGVPLKLTVVAVVNPLPVIVTFVAAGPLAGEKPLIEGADTIVKLLAVVVEPLGVVTVMGPVVAPAGTTTVICVGMSLDNAATAPLKLTVAPGARPVPVIMTVVEPMEPLSGEKLLIAGVTLNLTGLVAVPAAVVTVIKPVVAPAGTATRICVSVLTVGAAAIPLKLTNVAFARPLPEIVTVVPVGPMAGEMPEIVGGWITVKLVELVTTPPGVVTVTGPVLAPLGTIAVIDAPELTVKLAAAMPL